MIRLKPLTNKAIAKINNAMFLFIFKLNSESQSKVTNFTNYFNKPVILTYYIYQNHWP